MPLDPLLSLLTSSVLKRLKSTVEFPYLDGPKLYSAHVKCDV